MLGLFCLPLRDLQFPGFLLAWEEFEFGTVYWCPVWRGRRHTIDLLWKWWEQVEEMIGMMKQDPWAPTFTISTTITFNLLLNKLGQCNRIRVKSQKEAPLWPSFFPVSKIATDSVWFKFKPNQLTREWNFSYQYFLHWQDRKTQSSQLTFSKEAKRSVTL